MDRWVRTGSCNQDSDAPGASWHAPWFLRMGPASNLSERVIQRRHLVCEEASATAQPNRAGSSRAIAAVIASAIFPGKNSR